MFIFFINTNTKIFGLECKKQNKKIGGLKCKQKKYN